MYVDDKTDVRCPWCGKLMSQEGSYVYCTNEECGFGYDLDGDDLVDAEDAE